MQFSPSHSQELQDTSALACEITDTILLTWNLNSGQEVGVVVHLLHGGQLVSERVDDAAHAVPVDDCPRMLVDHVPGLDLVTSMQEPHPGKPQVESAWDILVHSALWALSCTSLQYAHWGLHERAERATMNEPHLMAGDEVVIG